MYKFFFWIVILTAFLIGCGFLIKWLSFSTLSEDQKFNITVIVNLDKFEKDKEWVTKKFSGGTAEEEPE